MEKSLECSGVTMHYADEDGSLPAVIVMHGWGCTSQTVASIAAIVAATGRRVISVDFPGFGKSSEPPTVWGVEEYTRCIEALLEKEKIENPVLIGHSFGGRVGIVLASRNAVDKLILVDAAGVKPRRSLRYYLKVYSFKLTKAILKALLGKQRAVSHIEQQRARSGSADYAQASPVMRGVLSRVVNEDLCHLMPLVKAPALLIWGEDDKATPLRDAKKMERLMPNAALVSFPGCGHYSFLDNPRQFAAVVQSFLSSQ